MRLPELDDLLGMSPSRLRTMQQVVDVRVECCIEASDTADAKGSALLSAEVQQLAAFWLRCQRALEIGGRTTAA